MKKTIEAAIGILLLFLSVFFISCPEPISDDLLSEVEDTVAPRITISTPDLNVQNFIESTITIAGSIVDYSNEDGTIDGQIKTATYADEFGFLGISGDIDVDENGDFSISFSALTIQNTFSIVITVTDWNGNSSEQKVTFWKDSTGPFIIVNDHDPDDFNKYSSALDKDIVITGTVGTDAQSFKYDVEWSGTNILDQNIIFDNTTGDFSFGFNPVENGVSGTLTFWLKAIDSETNISNKLFELDDDPDAPEMTGSLAWDNGSISLSFSEPVYHSGGSEPLLSDFTLDFVQGSGTATAASITGFTTAPAAGTTGLQFDIDVTGTPDGSETIDIHPVSGMITDRVGNPLAVSESIGPENLHDKSSPTVVRVSSTDADGTYYKEGDTVHVTVEFNETVTVTGSPVLGMNTGGQAVYTGGSGSTILTFGYTVSSGENTSLLNYSDSASLSGTVADSESNPADLTLPGTSDDVYSLRAKNLAVDTVVPALNSIVLSDTELIKDETATVTFTFSEAVTGFDSADVSTENGSLSVLSTSDNITFTGTFTPTDSYEDSTNIISVSNGAFTDSAENSGTGNSSVNYTIDTKLPTTTATPPEGYYAGTQTLTLSADESATIYYTTDGSTPDTGSSLYASPLTISDDTTIKFFARDDAGNSEAVNTRVYHIDATAPTLDSISFDDFNLTKNDTATVTFTFSEEVTDFDSADVTVENGTISSPATSNNITFTSIFTPTDNIEDSTNIITVNDDSYTDLAGNNGTGRTSDNYTIDTIAPLLNSIVFSDIELIKGETATVTFTFSENVSGFVSMDATVENGSLSSLSTSDDRIFTGTFTPSDGIEDTANTITVNDDTYTDLAGNSGTGNSSANYSIDTNLPTTTAAPPGGHFNTSQSVTLSVDESATIYYTTDGSTPNTGSDLYSSALTVSNDTTLKFFAVDTAGNSEEVVTEEYYIDTTAPTLDSISLDDSNLIKGETSEITFTFSEEVTDFDSADVTVENGTISSPATSNNITFTSIFTPTDNIEDSTNIITVNDDSYTDLAGNNGTGNTSDNYSIDTAAPALSGNADFSNGGTWGTADSGDTITLTFSEAVDPLSIDGGLTAGGNITDTFSALIAKVGSFSSAGDITADTSDLSLSGDGLTVTITLGGTVTGSTDPSGTFTSAGTIKDTAGNSIDTSATITKSGSW